MCETPGKMHMHGMVKIEEIVFEIVGLKAPTPTLELQWSQIFRIR